MDIPIVIPAYDEAESLEQLVSEIHATIAERNSSSEIIIADDGSSVGTQTVLRRICEQHDNVTGLSLRANVGKAASLNIGFLHTSGEIIITMDADLQDDPAEIPKLIELLDAGNDLVTGWKADRQDSIG